MIHILSANEKITTRQKELAYLVAEKTVNPEDGYWLHKCRRAVDGRYIDGKELISLIKVEVAGLS